MSPEHPLRGQHNYDDLAAMLLAEIADALLNGKRDWQMLEHLQAALIAPKGTERLKAVSDLISKSDADAVTKTYVDGVKSVYDARIYEQLKPMSVSREALEGISYGYTTDFFNTISTVNPSYYRMRPDPGKT